MWVVSGVGRWTGGFNKIYKMVRYRRFEWKTVLLEVLGPAAPISTNRDAQHAPAAVVCATERKLTASSSRQKSHTHAHRDFGPLRCTLLAAGLG